MRSHNHLQDTNVGYSRHQHELAQALFEDTDKARMNRERLANQARIDRENEQLRMWGGQQDKKRNASKASVR